MFKKSLMFFLISFCVMANSAAKVTIYNKTGKNGYFYWGEGAADQKLDLPLDKNTPLIFDLPADVNNFYLNLVMREDPHGGAAAGRTIADYGFGTISFYFDKRLHDGVTYHVNTNLEVRIVYTAALKADLPEIDPMFDFSWATRGRGEEMQRIQYLICTLKGSDTHELSVEKEYKSRR